MGIKDEKRHHVEAGRGDVQKDAERRKMRRARRRETKRRRRRRRRRARKRRRESERMRGPRGRTRRRRRRRHLVITSWTNDAHWPHGTLVDFLPNWVARLAFFHQLSKIAKTSFA